MLLVPRGMYDNDEDAQRAIEKQIRYYDNLHQRAIRKEARIKRIITSIFYKASSFFLGAI